MPNYDQEPERVMINNNSLLNVLAEIETELEILPGTINDLQGKLATILKPELESPKSEIASDIRPISNNSETYDRLVEILSRIRGAKYRIHEVTDRVQL